MLKAVIFDMDGVITDSEPLHARAAVMAAGEFGLELSIAQCYEYIGSTTRFMFEQFIASYQLTVSADDLLAANDKAKQQLLKEEGYQAVPGVKELIVNLFKQGVTLAIASSSSMNDIKAVTKALGISKYFTKLISGTTVPNPKPAPDIFKKALKELGMSHRECIVIEDSMNGVTAAADAGIPSIGFINPNSGNQDLSKASVLIPSFDHIDYNYISDALRRANGQPVTIASTRRLVIRELTVADIRDMYQIYQNPEITRYMDDLNEYLDVEMEKHKAYIKNVYGFYGYGLWGVFSKTSKALIGKAGIQNQMIDGQEEIELSYLLDVNHWGYGYALECTRAILHYAADVLEIPHVAAVIDEGNVRSLRVAEQIGMHREKAITRNGRNCFLYRINLNSEPEISVSEKTKGMAAAKRVQEDFRHHPADEVYSRRFSYKAKKE